MDKYILITNEMIQSKLKGFELLAYAVIYSFSNNQRAGYYGSYKKLSEMIGASKSIIFKVCKSLLASGFIEKREIIGSNKVKVISLKALPLPNNLSADFSSQNDTDVQAVFPQKSVVLTTNNTYNTNIKIHDNTDNTEAPVPNINKNYKTQEDILIVPKIIDIINYARYNNWLDMAQYQMAQKFLSYYEQRGWRNKSGAKIKSWQSALQFWHNNANNKIGSMKANNGIYANNARGLKKYLESDNNKSNNYKSQNYDEQ